MSADNYLTINRKTFEVRHCCASIEFDKGSIVGKGKDLEEAADIAQRFEKELADEGLYLEYGILFIGNKNEIESIA